MSPGRSSLWHLLYRQGIAYFLVALIANIIPAIFLMLNLNRMYFSFSSKPHDDCDYVYLLNSLSMHRNHEYHVLRAGSGCVVHRCLPCVHLSDQFPTKERHAHPPAVPVSCRPHPNRGSGNDANGSVAKKSEGAGNTIMGAAFHSIVAGIDAMDQTYSMDEPDVTRMTRTLAVRDLKCECDSGGADKNGHIVVHTETMVHEDNVSVDAGGFGMPDSLGHGQEQKGFYA